MKSEEFLKSCYHHGLRKEARVCTSPAKPIEDRPCLGALKRVAGMLKPPVREPHHLLTPSHYSESRNAKIQWVKYMARGFRNKKSFMNAIYSRRGSWNLLPDPHQTP
jgi:hypothetical protein